MKKIFKGRAVVKGNASAEALVSKGGFNTLASYQHSLMFGDKTGKCSDQNNPDLYKKPIAGTALCMPQTIGSTTGGLVLYCAACMSRQPACLLFSKEIDSLAAAGAILSAVWTDNPMPTVDNLGDEFLEYVQTGDKITVKEDGTVEAITPMYEDVPAKVKKQVVSDMSASTYPEKPVVPYIKVTQDRVVLEIQRGCIRGCRFCQAGMIYRPNRFRNLETLKEYAYKMLKNTGHGEISLSSLSSSDYPELKELTYFLIEEFGSQGVNISLPSLRIDAFSLDVMSKVQDIKKSSLTFAPEAGSQRMRNVINKGLTEEVILEGALEAFKGGWNKVKLYFMLGLPGETEEDQKGIAYLAQRIAEEYFSIPKHERNGRVQITASASFFVPKPFTPFQWATMKHAKDYMDSARLVNETFRQQVNRKCLSFKWHDAKTTILEGVLARGDRKLSRSIYEAYQSGCMFDSWTESFDYDKWMQAFEKTGIDVDFYTTRPRDLDEVFPWDFIDIGVTKEFMKREWKNAMEEKVTPNCKMQCSGCGAAKYKGGICYEN